MGAIKYKDLKCKNCGCSVYAIPKGPVLHFSKTEVKLSEKCGCGCNAPELDKSLNT
jgi:flavoprotein